MALAEEVVEEYKTSLVDLNFNSKPLINMLTMLAEDHEQHAPHIVKVIEDHITKCKREKKLPALYLIDSIMKNLGKSSYKSLFSKNIVKTFTTVFEQVDEKTRASMFKLRQTWSSVLPNQALYLVDARINKLLDPAWPITATPPEKTSIYVNPRFLAKTSDGERSSPEVQEEEDVEGDEDPDDQESIMRQQLISKQQELLKLQQARLELELAETQEKMKHQKKKVSKSHTATSSSTSRLSNLPLPSVADTLPLTMPELPQAPKDPRQHSRDPRLKRKEGHQAKDFVPLVNSSNIPPAAVPPRMAPSQVPADIFSHGAPSDPMQSYNGMPERQPYPHVLEMQPPGHIPGPHGHLAQPSVHIQSGQLPIPIGQMHLQGEVFTGEVFSPVESAKFSDDTDSDSSLASAQDTKVSNVPQKPLINIRDPRFVKKVEEEIKSRSSDSSDSSKVHKDTHHTSSHVPNSKVSKTDLRHQNKSSKEHDNRNSKERESTLSRHSPHKSVSGQQTAKSKNLPKEKEIKSDIKQKDAVEAKRKTDNEKKNVVNQDLKSNTKGRGDSKRKESTDKRGRSSRERERTPDKSPRKYPSRTSHQRGGGDRLGYDDRKGRKVDEIKERETKTDGTAKVETKTNAPKRVDKVKSSTLKEKLKSKSDQTVNKGVQKMETDEKKQSVGKSNKREKERRDKRSIEKDDVQRVTKKLKIDSDVENVSEDTMDENMEVEKPELKLDVTSKVQDDISDLFGSEDQDYRSVDQKGLPLKSPSSKGWDKFKASQPDQYAYDIELKKQRQEAAQDVDQRKNSVVDEQPQDIDYRLNRPDSYPAPEIQRQQLSTVSNVEIPKELSMDHHSEILIQAHKQLQEGQITHEQHQDLLRQLKELMHIQKLQEENRRLSSEMQTAEESEQVKDMARTNEDAGNQQADSDYRKTSPRHEDVHKPIPVEVIIPNAPPRDIRSPERPLERYRIPRKNRDTREDSPRKNFQETKGQLQKSYLEPSLEEARQSGQRETAFASRGPRGRQTIQIPELDPHDEQRREFDKQRHLVEGERLLEDEKRDHEQRGNTDTREQRGMPPEEIARRRIPPAHRQEPSSEGRNLSGIQERQEYPNREMFDDSNERPVFQDGPPIPREDHKDWIPLPDRRRGPPEGPEFHEGPRRPGLLGDRPPPDRRNIPENFIEDHPDLRGKIDGPYDRRGPQEGPRFQEGLRRPGLLGDKPPPERRDLSEDHPDWRPIHEQGGPHQRRDPPEGPDFQGGPRRPGLLGDMPPQDRMGLPEDHPGWRPLPEKRGLSDRRGPHEGPEFQGVPRRPGLLGDMPPPDIRDLPERHPEWKPDIDTRGPTGSAFDSREERRRQPFDLPTEWRGPRAVHQEEGEEWIGPSEGHPDFRAHPNDRRDPTERFPDQRLNFEVREDLPNWRPPHGERGPPENNNGRPQQGMREHSDNGRRQYRNQDGRITSQHNIEQHPAYEGHGPPPFDDRPIDEERRAIHDERLLPTYDGRSPFGPKSNTDRRGPVLHNDRLPPIDRRDPLIRDGNLPSLIDERGPKSYNGRGPPHDGRGPALHSGREHTPHERREHHNRGPIPHDGRGLSPHDGRGSVSNDGRDQPSHDRRELQPQDIRGPVHHDGKFPQSHGDRGPAPNDRRGLPPHDVRGPPHHERRPPSDELIPCEEPGPLSHNEIKPPFNERRPPVGNRDLQPHRIRGPPHHERRPQSDGDIIPCEGTGPVPHNERKPPLNERRPLIGNRDLPPHDARGPLHHGRRGHNDEKWGDGPRGDAEEAVERNMPHYRHKEVEGPQTEEPMDWRNKPLAEPLEGHPNYDFRGPTRPPGWRLPSFDHLGKQGQSQDFQAQRRQSPDLPSPDMHGVGGPSPDMHGPSSPSSDVHGPRGPSPELSGPRGSSPDIHGPRGPSPDMHGPRGPSPDMHGPRGPRPNLHGPMGSHDIRGVRPHHMRGPTPPGGWNPPPPGQFHQIEEPFNPETQVDDSREPEYKDIPQLKQEIKQELELKEEPEEMEQEQLKTKFDPHGGLPPWKPVNRPKKKKFKETEKLRVKKLKVEPDVEVKTEQMSSIPEEIENRRTKPIIEQKMEVEDGERTHTEHLPAFLGPANPKPSAPFRNPDDNYPGPRHGMQGPFPPRPLLPHQGGQLPRPHGAPNMSGPPRMGGASQQTLPPNLGGPPQLGGPPPPGGHVQIRGPPPQEVEKFVDKYGDPRFRSFNDIGPEVSEEVVFGKRNFEIKLGAPPRRIQWNKDYIEVFADPSSRGVVVDGLLLYKFGEKVKEVNIRGRKEKIFYHGKPLNIWIDGQQYEVRVDSPPKALFVNGKAHRIQIDGRDMMILINKEEKGKYGGEPRFVFIDEERMELRFDPPPRHILIDQKLCELKLNVKQPCVCIEGRLHGIRFDGPPREVFINGTLYQIFIDYATKVRVGSRFHYIALGGPCHELIVDGKWFEVKFSEPAKEINIGNRVLTVQLPGPPPEVKILPEIQQIPNLLQIPRMPIPPQVPPMPGHLPPGISGSTMPFRPPASLPMPMTSMPPPPIGLPASAAPMIPGLAPPMSVTATPSSQPAGMPNILSSLFGGPSAATSAPGAVPGIDITSLFSKLVSSGIIKKDPETKLTTETSATTNSKKSKPADKKEVVRPPEYINIKKRVTKVEFDDIPDKTELDIAKLKLLPTGSVQRLYAGIQCTSCGARFMLDDEEKTEIYRQHLDWHFRQNRRGKDDMKVARYRKWYYGVNDWIQYEEVGDTEEQGKSNFFEQQQQNQQTVHAAPSPSQPQIALITVPEGASVVKCPAATGNDNDDLCDICHEPFEQYWDEDLEEWHLRDAIRVNNKTYHPICYEDYTDVSEGTSSPSILNIAELDFSTRKTLTYDDEQSQDGLPHTSFEESRTVPSSDTVVKTEPTNTSEDSSVASGLKDSSGDMASHGGPVVKQEPLSQDSVNNEDVTDAASAPSIGVVSIKEEKVDEDFDIQTVSANDTDDVPMVSEDVTHTADFSETHKSDEKMEVGTTESENPVIVPGEQERVDNTENQDDRIGADIASSDETISVFNIASESKNTNGSIPGLEIVNENITSNDESIPCLETVVESETPICVSQETLSEEMVTEDSTIDPGMSNIETTPADSGTNEEEIEESTNGCDSDEEPRVDLPNESDSCTSNMEKGDISDVENVSQESAIVSQDITDTERVNNDQYRAETEMATESASTDTSTSVYSTHYAALGRVMAVGTLDIGEISEEVLEIGSNASTPTHDELPSPPGETL